MKYKDFDRLIPELLNKEVDGVRVTSIGVSEYVQIEVLRERNKDFLSNWVREIDKNQLTISYGIHFKNHLVGCITLFDFKEETISCSVSYWLDQSFIGFDIASKAIKIVCEYAYENLDISYVQAEIQRENTPSIFTAIKAGFKYSKNQDVDLIVNGVPKGHQIFIASRYEWNS